MPKYETMLVQQTERGVTAQLSEWHVAIKPCPQDIHWLTIQRTSDDASPETIWSALLTHQSLTDLSTTLGLALYAINKPRDEPATVVHCKRIPKKRKRRSAP